ncbi:MAG: glycosyltransferase family 4 protein [Acidobacteria bacterium]|nr:glycosyltransferase family 4 protein [Acidobacteriota bacterium]
MKPNLVYILPDKLGGVISIIANLLQHRRPDAFQHCAVLTHNHLDTDTRFNRPLAADKQISFEHRLPIENLRSVMRRLATVIPPGPGVLVSNDFLELAMLTRHDTDHTVYQLLHGDHEYYYDLAAKHELVIDAYIAYSRAMYEKLLRRLPHRRETIFHLRYGIALPSKVRAPQPGPLRLLFAGRLEHGQKGIFDLPQIDAQLVELGVETTWTVIGDGPHGEELKRRWPQTHRVNYLGQRTNAEVLDQCARHDVFVLPTRAEGFPVALLEAMGAGLVPVVSNIETGVPEVVTPGVTGFTPEVADIAGFADAIAELAANRDQLEVMSRAARQVVVEQFDIRERVADYQALFARYRELRRPRPTKIKLHYGSRLDHPWIPNAVVFPVRYGIRLMKGKKVR